jgi:hypothetical protein
VFTERRLQAGFSWNKQREKFWLNAKYSGKEESHGRFSYVAESGYMVDRGFYLRLCDRGLGLLQLRWLIAPTLSLSGPAEAL